MIENDNYIDLTNKSLTSANLINAKCAWVMHHVCLFTQIITTVLLQEENEEKEEEYHWIYNWPINSCDVTDEILANFLYIYIFSSSSSSSYYFIITMK